MSQNPPATVEGLLAQPLKYLALEWDPKGQVLTIRMRIKPIPCYSFAAMAEFGVVTGFVDGNRGLVRHILLTSDVPGVFNFGGDLALFVLLARAKDVESLRYYGMKCIELLEWVANAPSKDCLVTAVIQGDALGGGLESVLPAQRIVAETQVQAGFPEVLFNLFPGMGAWQFVVRRAGHAVAQKLIVEGKLSTGQELCELGLVDLVAPEGEGEAVAREAIKAAEPRYRGTLNALKAGLVAHPVSHESLEDVVTLWAQCALGLADRDLRLMERLVRAQLKKAGGNDDSAIAEIKRMELEEALALT